MTEDEVEEHMDSLPDNRQMEMDRNTGREFPVYPTQIPSNAYPHVGRVEVALAYIAERFASR